MDAKELTRLIADVEKQMRKAAADLNFEAAAELRDRMVELKKHLLEVENGTASGRESETSSGSGSKVFLAGDSGVAAAPSGDKPASRATLSVMSRRPGSTSVSVVIRRH
jgi:excinuclease ABC subunit B